MSLFLSLYIIEYIYMCVHAHMRTHEYSLPRSGRFKIHVNIYIRRSRILKFMQYVSELLTHQEIDACIPACTCIYIYICFLNLDYIAVIYIYRSIHRSMPIVLNFTALVLDLSLDAFEAPTFRSLGQADHSTRR